MVMKEITAGIFKERTTELIVAEAVLFNDKSLSTKGTFFLVHEPVFCCSLPAFCPPLRCTRGAYTARPLLVRFRFALI